MLYNLYIIPKIAWQPISSASSRCPAAKPLFHVSQISMYLLSRLDLAINLPKHVTLKQLASIVTWLAGISLTDVDDLQKLLINTMHSTARFTCQTVGDRKRTEIIGITILNALEQF